MMTYARSLPGVELVLDKATVCGRFQLPPDREGDFAIFTDRATVVGARREDHDLSALGEHRLRSHGGIGEQRVPFILSRPLTPEYREWAETGVVRNLDIFDFALNGVA
jgi:phosphonoacetate hydrolase